MNLLVKGVCVSTLFVMATHLVIPQIHYDLSFKFIDICFGIGMCLVAFIIFKLNLSSFFLERLCTFTIVCMCLTYLVTFFRDSHPKPSLLQEILVLVILYGYWWVTEHQEEVNLEANN